MKLFITGLAGMLGSNIAYELKKKYSISGVDLVNVNMPEVEAFCFDMLDFEKLLSCLEAIKPDIIIHTAAAVNVDRCEIEPEYAQNLNVKLTENICKIADMIQAKIIYISTDAVFDGKQVELYVETDETNPVNVYGKTKLQGENLVKQNKNNVLFRTNIYGFNIQEKDSFGEWIYNGLLKNQELNMFEDIDFSPILVNDLANVIDLAIQKKVSGLYHVCGTGCITKYTFGCELKKIFKIPTGKINKTQSDKCSFKAMRAKHMGMSNKNICDLLDCKIRTPIESIEEFYRLYNKGFKAELIEFGGIRYAD